MSVALLHGSDEFLVFHEGVQRTRKALKAGQLVVWEAADSETLAAHLEGSFFEEPKLVVIVGDCGRLPTPGNGSSALVLLPGQEKLPSWGSKIPSNQIMKFSAVPPFKRDEACLDFAKQEAKLLGLGSVSERLLVPLVVTCGSDRGVVSRELWKLSHLSKDPSLEDLKRSSLGPIQGDVWALLDGLGKRDVPRLARALRVLSLDSNVFRILPLLGKQVSQWLVASHLLAKGEGSRIPQVLELHPFVVKKSVLPPASKWPERALIALLRDLAQVGTESKQGIVSPWFLLQTALFRSLSTL